MAPDTFSILYEQHLAKQDLLLEDVEDNLQQNTTKVKNIKKYMLAALFNAPTTIDGYYQAEVHHDMPELAMRKGS